MASPKATIEQLEWAIRARTANQACSLRLLRLFRDYPDLWQTKKFARAAQDLVAVAFSLWRAAFLADKKGKRSAVFSHGEEFLQKMIEDNAISYPQDKTSREWTFNYYTRNARASLEILDRFWPGVAPTYEGKKRSPAERWEYCQTLFERAVDGFESLMASRQTELEQTKATAARRTQRRANRTKVRKLTQGRSG